MPFRVTTPLAPLAPTPLDRLTFKHAALAMAAAWAVAAVVVVTTDERTSTVAMRIARLLALGPLVASIGVFATHAELTLRGESRALMTLGVPPWQVVRGARVAGMLASIAAVALLLTPWPDTSSLFPVVAVSTDWVVEPSLATARAASVIVSAGGALEQTAHVLAIPAAKAHYLVLPCLAPFAWIAPEWASTPMSARARGVSLLSSAFLTIATLHVVAASSVTSAIGLVAVLPMATVTAFGRRRRGASLRSTASPRNTRA